MQGCMCGVHHPLSPRTKTASVETIESKRRGETIESSGGNGRQPPTTLSIVSPDAVFVRGDKGWCTPLMSPCVGLCSCCSRPFPPLLLSPVPPSYS